MVLAPCSVRAGRPSVWMLGCLEQLFARWDVAASPRVVSLSLNFGRSVFLTTHNHFLSAVGKQNKFKIRPDLHKFQSDLVTRNFHMPPICRLRHWCALKPNFAGKRFSRCPLAEIYKQAVDCNFAFGPHHPRMNIINYRENPGGEIALE